MKIFKKFKNTWVILIGIGIIALIVLNMSQIVKGFNALLAAALPLLIGAMLAFILNLIMDPVARWLEKSSHPFLRKHASTIGLASSIIITLILFAIIIGIVVPNLYDAIKVLTKELPGYLERLKSYLTTLFNDNPALKSYVASLDTNWESTLKNIATYFTKGGVGLFDSTLDAVTSIISVLYNLIIVLIFALFVLGSKQLFVKSYHLLCRLYLKPQTTAKLTRDLRILDSSYRAFVIGSLIQAAILIVLIGAADFILGIPYALMAAVIVGVINIIPMVGAFIGGGIAAFIIFTASPSKCLIFLILLVVIQEFSSNVLYPRIIGDRIGLPGIYVMITIVIAGALFGVAGMILAVPLVATLYRIFQLHLEGIADSKQMHEDPLVKDLHANNIKLNNSLQKVAYRQASKEGTVDLNIERQENINVFFPQGSEEPSDSDKTEK